MKSNTKIVLIVVGLLLFCFVITKISIGNESHNARATTKVEKVLLASSGDDYRKYGNTFEKYFQQGLNKDTKSKALYEELSTMQQQYALLASEKAFLENDLNSLLASFASHISFINSPDLKPKADKIKIEASGVADKLISSINQKAKMMAEQNGRITEMEHLLKMKLVLEEFKNADIGKNLMMKMDELTKKQSEIVAKEKN